MKMGKIKIGKKEKGGIIILVLIFGTIFLIIFSGIAGLVTTQLKHSRAKVAWNKSLAIAEAGLNYYRWRLAHAPGDLSGGGEYDYTDPEEGTLGKFSLEIQGSQQCGLISAITITSTGWTEQYPDTKRIVKAKYVKPTVADYAYLLNDNVWAGSDREIKGPYHSNGGIRMDGENKSLVTSALETWTCTESFGCDPPEQKPGVFTTASGNEDLFSFPVPPFDFDGITMDLAEIKSITQSGQGIYLPPSGEQGYHVILKSDQTIDVYEITQLDSIYAYDSETGWHWEDSIIDDENFIGNYPVPGNCGLVFIEDHLWIEGELSGKLTIVSADLIDPNEKTNIWLQGNIEYTVRDGTDGLVLVAQNNNLIGLYVPNRMELHGVFIAQSGHFGRNHYSCSWYWPECKRDYLEIFGSVVSNGRVGTKWSSGSSWISGFEQRENIYDPEQSFSPPVFLPDISEELQFREWEEIE